MPIIKKNAHKTLGRGFSFLRDDKTKGFGSFHSEDIEDLIRLSEADYKIPEIWTQRIRAREISNDGCNIVEFGHKFKQRFYHLDERWTFLNHGAFGASLKPAMIEANAFRETCEQQPLTFFDRELIPLIAYSIRQVAKYIHCPPTELLSLPNVTTGLNAVINSLLLTDKDEILYFNLTYGSTKKILTEYCTRSKSRLKMMDVHLPIVSIEVILDQVRAAISDNSKCIIIDHITSNSAIEFPVLEIAKICKQHGMTVIVDAAHSLFTQDVHIHCQEHESPDLSAVVDVWLSNGHKWLCAPKGCAFMWYNPSTMSSLLKPLVISHGYGGTGSRILSGFCWDGCRDYFALCSVPSTLEFWQQTSFRRSESPQDYTLRLTSDARDLLREEWGIAHDDTHCPAVMLENLPMSLVPLPSRLGGLNTRTGMSDGEAFLLQEHLHHERRIEVPIKHIQGRLYARISAHVHNELVDYKALASAIKSLV
jgi:isopenicillin-N epimerase